MSKALTKASTLKPEIRLAQAVSEFEAKLSDEQKSEFRMLKSQSLSAAPTPSDVQRLTAEVDRRMSQKFGGQCFGPRFTSFLQGVQQFAALGDVVVGGSQNLIACGVWSLVRMSLLSIVSVSNYVDKLSSMFMDIGRSTPRHQAMAMLYPQSTKLQSYLSEYFIVVVGLCCYLFKFGQKSMLQQFTSSLRDGDLKAFQTDLDKWASSIEKEMQVNEAQESSGFRALSRSVFKFASHQQKLATRNRVLNFCSTYDHEIVWKQTRKTGNTSLYTTFVEYEQWRDHSHPCTLVYTGKLGSGKSVLLANIIDDLVLSTEKSRSLVTYFFCRHDVPESLQGRTILGSLARQVLQTVVNLDTLLESCGDTHTTGDTDKILGMILQGYPPGHKTYFVIDGLDECDDEERRVLLQAIRKIQESLNVLVCASFRVEPNKGLQSITNRLLATRIIPLPENNPDIEAFIEAELARCLSQELLTIGDATLIFDIQDALLAGSQGMFLWVALQIQSLCSMKTDHAIRETLADLPKDLSQTFARILHRSGHSDRALQVKTLQLILAAHQPLTTEELREALSVIPGDTTWDPSKMLNDVHSALACCGCLITIDEEELTVRVVHHSVKQYILHGLGDAKHTSFSFEDAQRTMADIVVTYLGYSVFETQLSKVNIRPIIAQSAPSAIIKSTMGTSSAARQLAVKLLKSRKQLTFDMSKTVAEVRSSSDSKPDNRFKFYDYANTNWLNHILHVSGRDDQIYRLSGKLIRSRMSDLKVLDGNQRMYYRLAARNGNGPLLEYMLQFRQIGANTMDMDGRMPLRWAVECGYKDVVELLLDMDNVDVNAKDWTVSTPTALILAVTKNHKDIVELLLRDGKADVNAKNDSGYTAIMLAVDVEEKDIVELLLKDRELDVNAKDNSGRTALLIATRNGFKDIVKLMLTSETIDVNTKDDNGDTALMMAVRIKHEDLVKLILTSGKVDFSAKDEMRQTALLVVAYWDREMIERMQSYSLEMWELMFVSGYGR